jgi:hypothetical protein
MRLLPILALIICAAAQTQASCLSEIGARKHGRARVAGWILGERLGQDSCF